MRRLAPENSADAESTRRLRIEVIRAYISLCDWPMIGVLGFAFVIRVLAIFVFPSLHHPDENFQFLEQAHRIAFGYGIKPWEFDEGIRSLLLPSIFARLFAVVGSYTGGPRGYIAATRILLAAMSIPAVAAVYNMGRRRSETHALIVGLVAAGWFELVYFSYRPLTEAISTDFLLVALAMASVPQAEYTVRRLSVIGFCLSMSLMLRVHLAAGLLVAAIWVGRAKFRERWVPMALAAIPALVAFGASDWVAWGTPFHSYLGAIRINVVEGKASGFGVQPIYWYLQRMSQVWAGAFPILILLAALRLRESKLWLCTALSVILTHSLIPHKEYRFVYPAFVCIVLAAAMASADLVEKARVKLGTKITRHFAVGAAGIWMAVSTSLAFAPGFVDNWFKRKELIESFFSLSDRANLCGLLLYDHSWGATGGYAYLHRNVPIYAPRLDEGVAKHSESAFNFVILKRSSVSDFEPDFALQSCTGDGNSTDVCVMMRSGACTRDSELVPLLDQERLGEPSSVNGSR